MLKSDFNSVRVLNTISKGFLKLNGIDACRVSLRRELVVC